ncbi:MAG: HNH endonuclease family protein [Gaiellales bacterium]
MLLWRIEEQLRAEDHKAEQGLAAPTNLTLEHLILQSWEQHWPLDDTHEDPIGWRNTHLHKLGNLTLTTGALNASLSNGP